MNSLRDMVPLVPGFRTESPQLVSSARRRLSTDEMQLREVGKLAVYLRKMRWLQRPSHRALSQSVSLWWDRTWWGSSLFCWEHGPPLALLSVVGGCSLLCLSRCLLSGSHGTVAVQRDAIG
jgi:hypothetical protein